MDIDTIFRKTIDRQLYQLELFAEVDEGLFHEQYAENTWSSEAIYRHLLMSTTIIINMITENKSKPHKLAISGGPSAKINLDDRASVQDVRKAINETSGKLFEIMNKIPDDRWMVKKPDITGKEIRTEERVLGLLLHNSEHLGEVKWIFKRLTGWGDNEMYKIKQ